MGCSAGLPVDGRIGISLPVYQYRLKKEVAECAYFAGNLSLAERLLNAIIQDETVPEAERSAAEENVRRVREKME